MVIQWITFFNNCREHKNLTALPQHLQRLIEYEHFVHQCSELHNAIRSKYKKNKKKGNRAKRDLLVFPGTKWCGRGSNSQNFEDLGEYTFADRCCRWVLIILAKYIVRMLISLFLIS